MSSKLVSIVLPTFNGEKYIRDSIQSCLAQTHSNWELIVVNDASTDGTEDIVKQYCEQDERIRLISHSVNRKLPAALNTGFKNARGEYLTWTSDDNLYREMAIERMVDELETNSDVDLVYTDYDVIDELDNYISTVVVALAPNLMIGNCIGACFLYRKRVQEIVGDYEEEVFLAEDYDFWVRAYVNGLKFRTLHENLYLYRVHSKSLTSNYMQRARSKAQIIRKKYFFAPLYQQMLSRAIFIWGTGNAGKEVLHRLHESDLKVAGFIDNDKMKWYKKVDGIEVYSPLDLLNFKDKSPFVIVGSMYFAEIEKDLVNMGFIDKSDFISANLFADWCNWL